jgi:hypothetical protein
MEYTTIEKIAGLVRCTLWALITAAGVLAGGCLFGDGVWQYALGAILINIMLLGFVYMLWIENGGVL